MGASGIAIDIGEQLEPAGPIACDPSRQHAATTTSSDVTPGRYFRASWSCIPQGRPKSARFQSWMAGPSWSLQDDQAAAREITYFWKNEEAGETDAHKKLVIFRDAGHAALDHCRWYDDGRIHRPHPAYRLAGWWPAATAMAGAIFAVIVLLLRKLVLEP